MTGHEPVIIMSQASKGIEYTSWLEPLSCILNLGTVSTDSTTTRLYYTWIYASLWQGIITCYFAERKNMRQWAQTLTIKGFTRYSFTIQFQLLSGRPASRQDRSAQESCSVHIRTCARAYIYSFQFEDRFMCQPPWTPCCRVRVCCDKAKVDISLLPLANIAYCIFFSAGTITSSSWNHLITRQLGSH